MGECRRASPISIRILANDVLPRVLRDASSFVSNISDGRNQNDAFDQQGSEHNHRWRSRSPL